MRVPGLTILKFGGSVLTDESTLRRAVHEIHRWRRQGERVVAVVSALAGTTDELTRQASAAQDAVDDTCVATLLSGGERHAAALLGLLLDRAGIPSRVLSPETLQLTATGPVLDADPSGLDQGPLLAAFAANEVAVVPGFAACDPQGRTKLLGRGGSDLTALFLAHRLKATRCRLIKDVDGIYTSDPRGPGPPPRKYATVAWKDALATDGSIVQHKAIRFARDHDTPFELGRMNGTEPTRIGPGPTRFAEVALDSPPLRVALLGLGTVGAGVHSLLTGLTDTFEVTSIAVRDTERSRADDVPVQLLTSDVSQAIAGADVVVETMGGLEPATSTLHLTLLSGADVVTANKAVIAASGDALRSQAERVDRTLLCSAAVGGSAPVLEYVRSRDGRFRGLRGVLNGTVNFALSEISQGQSLDQALATARLRGFAEQDASRDLSGQDAADKLAVIAGTLGLTLDPRSIPCEALDANTTCSADDPVRQVSTLWLDGGRARGRVTLEALGSRDSLRDVHGVHNAAQVEYEGSPDAHVVGKGAGRWPTAESVVGDLLEIARDRRRRSSLAGGVLQTTGPSGTS